MTSSRQALGRWGETLAANFLDSNGYRVIERNFRTPYGEIDIVAEEGSFLVFVEVKTRATENFGMPEESITQQKRQHIIAAAQSYLQTYLISDTEWRIDVISIRKINLKSKPEIIHFENAIT